MRDLIKLVEKGHLREDLSSFEAGDNLRVHFKVFEGGKERSQMFQGIVIKSQGQGVRKTFTLRKISFGVGVEKTFPLNSPKITKIKVISRGRARRAKLYYLRKSSGKKAALKEKRLRKRA